MASDSAVKGAPTQTPSSNPADSYIGSFISLVSRCEIRYEGVLYLLNVHDSTIGLKDVRSYGTEGRRNDGPQVPPSDKVYEYILFRGNDIKNLQIKPPPTSAKSEEQTFSDPAIIQSQYSGVPSSPVVSVGGRGLTESAQNQDTPAITSKALSVGLPSRQSATQLGPPNQSAPTQVAGHPSFSTPMNWQGDIGISSNSSNSLLQSSALQSPSIVSPLSFQNWMQTPETQAPTKVGRTSLSDCGLPVSSAGASSLVNLTLSPSPTSLQISDSLDVPSLFSAETPVPYSTSMTFNGSNIPSFVSPLQDINSIVSQVPEKNCPDPRPIYPGHSVHHPASSFVGSTSGPFPAPPSLLTPDQFAHSEEHLSPLTQNLTPNGKDMGSLIPASSGSSVLVSQVSQAPLLPLPTLVQKPQSVASRFTEEFDFEAMNEKFKKDEVWGSLGQTTTKIEGVDENASSISLGDGEIHGMIPNPKSAYKKDDFFDTISCNSMTRGRGGQNRLSERMKLDTETFGNFHQRPNVGYGGYGAGRGTSFRGSHNWGRGYGYGYGYGGRGRGPSFPFN